MNGCDLDSRARPFHLNPDPRYFYCVPAHRRIVKALINGIDGHAVPIVLTGEPGTGKTALIHETLIKLPPETLIFFKKGDNSSIHIYYFIKTSSMQKSLYANCDQLVTECLSRLLSVSRGDSRKK